MNNWAVLVHHAAMHHSRPGQEDTTPRVLSSVHSDVGVSAMIREPQAAMLPMNTTPLNERLIRMLIEEHQAEIRRCFAPRPGGGRAVPGAWLPRLLIRRRRLGQSPARQGMALHARETE